MTGSVGIPRAVRSTVMKRALVLVLTDEELLELCRITLDRDAQAALQFLDEHLKEPASRELKGG